MRGARWILVCLLTLGWLWPAFWNGGPFCYIDTRTYMRSADAALEKLTHRRTEWTAEDSATTAPADALHNVTHAPARSLASVEKKGVMLGRSLFWASLLHMGEGTGFWLTALVQAATLTVVLALLIRTLGWALWPTLPLMMLALETLSTAPWFADYMLPDLFASLAVVTAAALLAIGQITRLQLGAWALLLLFMLLSHDTTLPVIGGMLVMAAIWQLTQRLEKWRGMAVVLACLLTAVIMQAAVAWGIGRTTHQEPLRFPLLEARLIADGPGTAYLNRHCPQAGLHLCAYRTSFPMGSYEFLFGTEPGHAVYETASYEERRALSHEQLRFAIGVLREEPLGVLKSAGKNWVAQYGNFDMTNFSYNAGMKETMQASFPPRALAALQRSRAWTGTVGEPLWTKVLLAAALAAWLTIALLWRGRTAKLQMLATLLLTGVALNALVCGALSISEARYQARVEWLVPLTAVLFVAERRRRA